MMIIIVDQILLCCKIHVLWFFFFVMLYSNFIMNTLKKIHGATTGWGCVCVCRVQVRTRLVELLLYCPCMTGPIFWVNYITYPQIWSIFIQINTNKKFFFFYYNFGLWVFGLAFRYFRKYVYSVSRLITGRYAIPY